MRHAREVRRLGGGIAEAFGEVVGELTLAGQVVEQAGVPFRRNRPATIPSGSRKETCEAVAESVGMMLITTETDRQATIAMVIIAVFGLEVIRVLVKKV